jgi:oligopeptide transport system ATP-binding protein
VKDETRQAVVWITHDLIAGIADRVMVMYGGQVVETDRSWHDLCAMITHDWRPWACADRRRQAPASQPPILTRAPSSCPFARALPVPP